MAQRKWSAKVMERSDALDLESGVFTKGDPKAIARSLKRSAEHSKRRKAEPFRSAMSMLTFFINRGGKNLSKSKRLRWNGRKTSFGSRSAASPKCAQHRAARARPENPGRENRLGRAKTASAPYG